MIQTSLDVVLVAHCHLPQSALKLIGLQHVT